MDEKIISKNQYLILENWKISERKLSSDAGKLLGLRANILGGTMSSLKRNGFIKPIWRENREILWERIK